MTARLTQDCLENLFSCVRSANPIPTPLEFKQHLRLITVAQYLKPSEHGSYEEDDGCLLADFLDVSGCVEAPAENEDSFANELYASCASFDVDDVFSSLSEELSIVELNSLYYVGGYVVSRLSKNEFCDACIHTARCAEIPPEINANVTRLVVTKEYKAGCLVYCSQLAFNLFQCAEFIIRKHQTQFLSASGNIQQQLITSINSATATIIFPTCHNIKYKLINRYVTVRLYFFAKKEQKMRQNISQNATHELGSKSMAMNKLVQSLK